MPSNFVKQPQQLSAAGGGFLNGGLGDAIVGGLITGVPAGLNISQGIQTCPGDRMVLGEEDAAALADTDIGTLYGGILQYVRTDDGSTATPTINRAMFWDVTVAGSQFQATPDESGAQGVSLFAGVCINTLTKGYNWWLQTAGRVSVLFRAALTGVAADGQAAFLAAAGAGADVGCFDVLDGAGSPTFTEMCNAMNRYVGPAQGVPANGTASTINLPLGRTFRW